jgi:hypothetical protein
VFSVRNVTFICVSLKSFVIFLVSLPLYVKVAHLVFWYCGSGFMLFSCWLGCFVSRFILYLLLCNMSFMMFNSFFFASFVIGYVCNLFPRWLILDILCLYWWQESFGIMTFVCVGFIYIANSSFVFL